MSEKNSKVSKGKEIEKMKIYGLPNGAVMWPTAFAALVLGSLGKYDETLLTDSTSLIFFSIFAINLLILFFDFSRGTVVGIIGIAVAIIAIVYTQDIKFPLDELISKGLIGGASPEFLIAYGTIFLLMLFFAIFFKKHFDYFELTSNEIVRKHGILGDAERFNAPNLHIKKHIIDVFESLLLFGSGDLVIITSRGQEFNIQNVPKINKIEKNIRSLLGKLEVDVNRSE